MLAFHIGQTEHEYVRVTILGDAGDGWLAARVEMVLGAFRGSYSACFNSCAFSRFRDELKELHRSLAGVASFTSYEGQLEIKMTCSAQGHVSIGGEAVDHVGTGNTLTFVLELDQTYIPRILSDLQSALERYPPRPL